MSTGILNEIWAGNLEACNISEMSAVPQLLASLIALPVECFRLKDLSRFPSATASFAGEEVLPGASLADVLFEECGVEVTDETIVYIEADSVRAETARCPEVLGQLIGDVIVKLATDTSSKAVPSAPGHEDQLSQIVSGGMSRFGRLQLAQ